MLHRTSSAVTLQSLDDDTLKLVISFAEIFKEEGTFLQLQVNEDEKRPTEIPWENGMNSDFQIPNDDTIIDEMVRSKPFWCSVS